MLQAYALQEYISREFGCEVEIINFSNKAQQRVYSLLYLPFGLKDIARNILNLMFYLQLKRQYNDFNAFSREHFSLSAENFSTLPELENAKLPYDILITGSDQIWNINAQDCDCAYFLPFMTNVPKFAYAVSLGGTNIANSPNKEKYARYINQLTAVSVREKNAKTWVESISSKNVDICVDPTLLVDSSFWDNMAGEREFKEKYIFWYTNVYRKDMRDIILAIGKKYNLPVYVINAKEWSRRALFLHGIKCAKNGGPKSFLSMIKNAEMVFTSSFHGSIFCNVFKKNFWHINVHNKTVDDDRAFFLLDQLGLSNRYINLNQILNYDLSKPPEYNIDVPMYKQFIPDSKKFLKTIIQEY